MRIRFWPVRQDTAFPLRVQKENVLPDGPETWQARRVYEFPSALDKNHEPPRLTSASANG